MCSLFQNDLLLQLYDRRLAIGLEQYLRVAFANALQNLLDDPGTLASHQKVPVFAHSVIPNLDVVYGGPGQFLLAAVAAPWSPM